MTLTTKGTKVTKDLSDSEFAHSLYLSSGTSLYGIAPLRSLLNMLFLCDLRVLCGEKCGLRVVSTAATTRHAHLQYILTEFVGHCIDRLE